MKIKHCIACQEEIKQEALKCPHCHQVQTKSANWVNTTYGSWILIAIISSFILWLIYGIYALSIDEKLTNQFKIGESVLNIADSKKESKVSCFSILTNNSSVRWGDFSLQAEFYNKEGEVIDVHYDILDNIHVYPLFSFNARVSGLINAKAIDYVSCKISIIDAVSY